MTPNPQSGSSSGSSGGGDLGSRGSRTLPPLFVYMETGDWARAADRAQKHPREVKTWASIRTKSTAGEGRVSGAKRLALHHACFKLRGSASAVTGPSYSVDEDPFIEVCRFILLLLQIYPEAASARESRHGCLPLHLAAFASCTLPSPGSPDGSVASELSQSLSSVSAFSSPLPSPAGRPVGNLPRPGTLTRNGRSASESTADTLHTTMSAAFAEELQTGTQTEFQNTQNGRARHRTKSSLTSEELERVTRNPPVSLPVSAGTNILISEKREEWAVRVLNALLDAHPKGIRTDSEGGRLPLHTACAGRATPRVITTLLTAYPAAARHRNKDSFLPLHLVAHWGVSHPQVAIALLKAYPDATFGRNRWERSPLEEALSMAGENGRPHQAALVRSLRKHPSYWTRPVEIMEAAPRPRQIVDIDETLPSNEDESTEEDEFRMFGRSAEYTGKASGATMFGRSKKDGEGIEAISPVVADLPTLIRNQNWDGVLAKLEMNPLDADQDLQVATRGGFTSITGFSALHYACERRPPIEVVNALIAACPVAVSKRAMPGGALPLHIACTWYAPVAVVSALVTADRAACKTPDELGNLPLHSACFSGTGTAVVESLLRSYPKATLMRNNQGSLPEEISKRLRHENRRAVIAILELCKEDILAKRQGKHRKNRSEGFIDPVAIVGRNQIGEVKAAHDGVGQELVWI